MVKEEDAKTSASSLTDVVAPGRLDTADMKPWFTKSGTGRFFKLSKTDQ
jgi:hypothetical protein